MNDKTKNTNMICPKCGVHLEVKEYNYDSIECPYCDYKRIEPKRKSVAEQMDHVEKVTYASEEGRLKAAEESDERRTKRKIKRIVIGVSIAIVVVLASVGIRRISLPKVDPFTSIDVECSGFDGKGKCQITMLNDSEEGKDVNVNKINYTLSSDEDLSSGQTVTVRTSSDDYRLSETKKVYTVSGLEEYLVSVDQLSEDNI